MKNKLLSLSGNPARAQYILMRRIRPHTRKNKIIKRGVMSDLVDTVTEVKHFIVRKKVRVSESLVSKLYSEFLASFSEF